MSKFIKTLIIINGLIIPLFGMIILIRYISNNFFYNYEEEDIEGIYTENVIKVDTNLIVIQGLDYYTPKQIDNTESYYMTISVKVFKTPKPVSEKEEILYDIPITRSYEENYLNIIFFDKEYKVLNKLLDKKASIKNIYFPKSKKYREIEPTIKNIGYLITFVDSNKDGILNSNDEHDFFISDLQGKNLIQVTQNINIISIDFYSNNSKILITYTERKIVREEYKLNKFAIYDIDKNQLNFCSEIDNEIKTIENILNK